MGEEPKRRLSDRLGMSRTVIAESTSIVGDVITQGPLMVSGHVQGNGRIGGTLSMSKSAQWEGDISARQAVLAGTVTGSLVPAGAFAWAAAAVAGRAGEALAALRPIVLAVRAPAVSTASVAVANHRFTMSFPSQT